MISASNVDRINEAGSSLMRALTRSVETMLSGTQAATAGENGVSQGFLNGVANSRTVQVAANTGIAPGEWIAPMSLLNYEFLSTSDIVYMLHNAVYIVNYANNYSAQYGFTFPTRDVSDMNIRGYRAMHNPHMKTTFNAATDLPVFVGDLRSYYVVGDSGAIVIQQDPYTEMSTGKLRVNASVFVGGAIQDEKAGAFLRGKA